MHVSYLPLGLLEACVRQGERCGARTCATSRIRKACADSTGAGELVGPRQPVVYVLKHSHGMMRREMEAWQAALCLCAPSHRSQSHIASTVTLLCAPRHMCQS
jgi:hypothetical protein